MLLPFELSAQDAGQISVSLRNGSVITGAVLDNYPPVYAILRTACGQERIVDYAETAPKSADALQSAAPSRYGPDRFPEISGLEYSTSQYRALDRVHMKGGKVITGVITEKHPEDYLVLLWPSGEEWYCYYVDIDSVTAMSLSREMEFRQFRRHSAAAAALFSAFIPGLGHVHNGDYLTAALFAGSTMVLTAALFYSISRSIVFFDDPIGSEREFGTLAEISFISLIVVHIADAALAGTNASEKETLRRVWQVERCSLRQRTSQLSLDFGVAPIPGGGAAAITIHF